MASSSREPEGDEDAEGQLHFFRIILEENLQEGKLGIPKMFVQKYGNVLSNSVFLEVPTGAVWEVDMKRHNGRIWLEKGWQEFAEYYSLKYGHFLVFKYQGNSHFYVLIFDTSATEVDYPVDTRNGDEVNHDAECEVLHMEEAETDVSIEIMDDIFASPQAGEKSPMPDFGPHKKMNSTPRIPKSESQGGIRPSPSNGWGTMSRRKRSFAEENASNFTSENPFFVVSMKPSYVRRPYGHCMNVPFIFAARYLTTDHGNIILRISDGRVWPVDCRLYKRKSSAKFGVGWRKFSEDNNLKAGDTCVFELLKSPEISLKVFIYRVSEDAHRDPSNGGGGMSTRKRSLTVHENVVVPSRARSFQSENPFVVVSMKPSYFGRKDHGWYMHIPFKFAKTYFPGSHGTMILRVSDGRTWPVNYRVYPKLRIAQFGLGWRKFLEDNNLQVGDDCVFELLEGPEISINVVIYGVFEGAYTKQEVEAGCSNPDKIGTSRDQPLEDQFTSRDLQVPKGDIETEKGKSKQVLDKKAETEQVAKKLSPSRTRTAFVRASEFTSNHPFFKVVISESFLRYDIGPTVPSSLCERYMDMEYGVKNGSLQMEDKLWPVGLSCSDKGSRLMSGWLTFARDNDLRVGDICIFEMIKFERDDILLNVSIFRGLA